jgi:hypothetical protein
MTAIGARRADCPPWCASDHTGTDETSRPFPHFGERRWISPDSPVSVFPASLGQAGGPEVVIDRVPRAARTTAAARTEEVNWVRLSLPQAVNLAAIMADAGQGRLAGLIRQAVADIVDAEG